MLSIIICSVNEQLLINLKDNIKKTIAVEYELLVWDNAKKQSSLCQVYNEMAGKAQYPYLCFCHEDIKFETKNWGKILQSIFEKDNSIGLIGVAGSKYKSSTYSGWYTGIAELDCYKILHEVNGVEELLISSVASNSCAQQVVCIDGVFMVCKKTVWQNHRFNESVLQGFHFYDIDFSLRIAKGNKVVVTNNILIRHITKGGDYGDRWIESAFQFHKSMKDIMPFPYQMQHAKLEDKIAKNWLDRLKVENISMKNKIKWIRLQQLHLNIFLWYPILKFLFYKPFGMKSVHNFFKRF